MTALLVVLSGLPFFPDAEAQEGGFVFSFAGSFHSFTGFDSTVRRVGRSNAAFTFALGDLSYGDLSEAEWCQEYHNHFPDVLILAGTHDTEEPPFIEGNINLYAQHCPYTLSAPLTGVYAKEYFFDYPAGAPLARFILISPDIQFVVDDGERYAYHVGTQRYDWTRDAIDGARAAGIPWVIVGMHANCIVTGSHACETGTDILNLLVDRKVDLIIQGQTRYYARSKQLAVNPAQCTTIRIAEYNPGCVVDEGFDGQYARGGGPVLIIAGIGGRDLQPFDLADPLSPYFSAWMDGGTNGTGKGVVEVEVTESEMVTRTDVSGTYDDTATVASAPASLFERLAGLLPFVVAIGVGLEVLVIILYVRRRRRRDRPPEY